MDVRFTEHALLEMRRRQIPIEIVAEVIESPNQIVFAHSGRKAFQSTKIFPNGRTYLVRVIVDTTSVPPMVRTVYRTSKIAKYWRGS
jgi:hypothetical protein